ncbi:MAG: hypothetical protein IMW86_06650 [Hydrogenibacillus sp.]|nr:hypothetical protein [Hydrogenibacillus sp.]
MRVYIWMAASAAATVLFAAGFVLAVGVLLFHWPLGTAGAGGPVEKAEDGASQGAEEAPGLPAAGGAGGSAGRWTIVALGDSIMRGIGDDAGGGVAARLRRLLAEAEAPEGSAAVPAEPGEGTEAVTAVNLAVAGYRSRDLAAQLEEPGVRHALSKADLILLSIGGNDAFPSVDVLLAPEVRADEEALKAFRETMAEALMKIRAANPAAPIFWLELYDPFFDVEGLRREAEAALGQWNEAIAGAAASAPGVVVVPTNDLLHAAGRAFLAADHFHPSALGHALLAERIRQDVQAHRAHRPDSAPNPYR